MTFKFYNLLVLVETMVHPYSLADRKEFLALYNLHKYNASAAARQFNEENAHRNIHVDRKTIKRTIDLFAETASVHPRKYPAGRGITMKPDFIKKIVRYFENDPYASVRKAARALGCKKSSVHKVLHNLRFKSYKQKRTQQLYPNDHEIRKRFCKDLQNAFQRNPGLLDTCLIADETIIHSFGFSNRQITRYLKTNCVLYKRMSIQNKKREQKKSLLN